jgi:hypothetical protein
MCFIFSALTRFFLFWSTVLYIDVQDLCIDFEATYETVWRKEIWSEMDKLRF